MGTDDSSLQADSQYKLVDLVCSMACARCCSVCRQHHKHHPKYYYHCYDWYKDSLWNKNIRAEVRVKRNHAEETQLMWYGHIKSMSDSRLSHQLLNWKPVFTRLSGRPSRCCIWIEEGARTSQTGLQVTCYMVYAASHLLNWKHSRWTELIGVPRASQQ